MNRTLHTWKFTLSSCLLALLVQDLNAEEAKTKKVKLQDIQLEVPVG